MAIFARIEEDLRAYPRDEARVRLQLPHRGVAQPGIASGLGPEGRRFESYRPDHKNKKGLVCEAFFYFCP